MKKQVFLVPAIFLGAFFATSFFVNPTFAQATSTYVKRAGDYMSGDLKFLGSKGICLDGSACADKVFDSSGNANFSAGMQAAGNVTSPQIVINGATPTVNANGAGPFAIKWTAGQNATIDEASAGTSSVSIGTANATQVTIGRSGQSTAINGSTTVGNKITNYGGVTTAGQGVAPIYAATAIAGVSTSTDAATVTTFTPGSAGVFEVGAHLAVTAWTAGNVGVKVTYTDCQATARTWTMYGTNVVAGTSTNAIASTGEMNFYSGTICANAAAIAVITWIQTTATGTFWGHIKQIQ